MKNIYSLGAYQISPNNFKLNISRLDDKSGIEKPIMEEGINTKGKLWMQLLGLDNLDQQNDKKPDGYFDFLDGITIDSQNGVIIFPVLEPFGSDLAKQFDSGRTGSDQAICLSAAVRLYQNRSAAIFPAAKPVCYPGYLFLAGRFGIPVECHQYSAGLGSGNGRRHQAGRRH